MTQSDPNLIQPLTLDNLLRFRSGFKPSLALKVVRVLVGLEYGFVVVLYASALLYMGNHPEVWLTIPFVIIFGILYYCACAFGITMMVWRLEAVDDRAAIEMWAFIALGLAPLSAVFYTLIVFNLFDVLNTTTDLDVGIFLLAPITGFYFPFILPNFWLRYHHREDEF